MQAPNRYVPPSGHTMEKIYKIAHQTGIEPDDARMEATGGVHDHFEDWSHYEAVQTLHWLKARAELAAEVAS